jgi:hypothetical protein
VVRGTVTASFTIEDFSLNRLRKTEKHELAGRLAELLGATQLSA